MPPILRTHVVELSRTGKNIVATTTEGMTFVVAENMFSLGDAVVAFLPCTEEPQAFWGYRSMPQKVQKILGVENIRERNVRGMKSCGMLRKTSDFPDLPAEQEDLEVYFGYREMLSEPPKDWKPNNITRAEYLQVLRDMRELANNEDPECAHGGADWILLDLLNRLGFDLLTSERNGIDKWYS